MDTGVEADFRAGRLRTRLRALAIVCALLTVVAIPACYLAVVYFAQKEALQFQARLATTNVARYAYANGPLWIYHVHRLDELLASVQNPQLETVQTIYDAGGAELHVYGSGCHGPSLRVGEDIVVIGARVGRVDVCESFVPFLWRSLLFLAFGAGLGALTYFAVQRLPVSALDRTLAELAHTYHRLRGQVAETSHAYKLLQEQSRKIEEQAVAIAEARDEAQAANKAKTDFLANMSHELRTPLNAIIGFSELMRSETLGPLSGRYKEYAGDINDSGSHLLMLVDDILDVSRIETGKVELVLTLLDLRSVLAVCVRMVRERALKGKIVLEEALGKEQVVVQGDLTRLKQVFLNLLANAVRFTPPEGRVTVTIRQDAGHAVVTVRDTGVGMASGYSDGTFGVHNPQSAGGGRRLEGSGLGLPIAKSLISLHGGTLTIDSTPGAGTCVRVELALVAAPLRQVS